MRGSSSGGSPSKPVIAAARRRRIVDWVREHGSANISALSAAMGVTENTIRSDLDLLHDQGKLIRSRGGAIVKERPAEAPPYSEERNAFKQEKSWIGAAAVSYLPPSGSVFINAGTTTYELAVRIPPNPQIRVTTNSPDVALTLARDGVVPVHLLGGWVNPLTLASDYSLSEEPLHKFFWDACFMGASAIDLVQGIMAIDLNLADSERAVIESSKRVVVLCDSSKLGRYSHVKIGPVSLIDVLITDSGIDPDTVKLLGDEGVEVVVVDASQEDGNTIADNPQ